MTEITSCRADGHPAAKSPAISFEFFPPKTEEMERSLWETINRLAPLTPNFVSVTYGAGGSTRERTHSTIARILSETHLTPAAHLTCVGAARGEIDDIVSRYHDLGVRHIVALRGDPPGGIGTAYTTHPDGYRSSAELVAGIKRRHGDIEVSVSAYPEKHPESRDFDADIDVLKAKVDAGAARAITQVFFDNDLYLPLSRPGPRPRHRHSDRARHHADAQFQAGPRLRDPRRHHACRTGSPTNSTASTTIPRPASWWQPPSPPARCKNSPSTASTPFTSTP